MSRLTEPRIDLPTAELYIAVLRLRRSRHRLLLGFLLSLIDRIQGNRLHEGVAAFAKNTLLTLTLRSLSLRRSTGLTAAKYLLKN